MPILVARFVQALRSRVHGWRAALAVGLFVFGSSWLAMWLAEPGSNAITEPQNYWWYFLVTGSTVGYGDFFPETGAGHVVGGYVIVGGIATLTILFTELASHIQSVRGKRMKGVVALDLADHIVILGYHPGRTERIVQELLLEERVRELVLCAWDDVPQHPMPEQDGVLFVRGDLRDADVLKRACVDRAATVVIDARDDNEALALAVAVDHLRPEVHMVAALHDMNRAAHLRYVSPTVQCVQWHVPNLLTEEALDPGITEVYADLMSSRGEGNTYSVRLPEALGGQQFGACQQRFGRDFGATVIAVRQDGSMKVSPPWDAPLRAGAVLYYLAGERIDESRLAARTR
ncbi:ion channel [Streptomyces sp. DSM 42041]|uniref:Ion channel n=1 Tax=Streptomyces hazeniae TaxID=3075538 RepID=A0ABU2NPJ7_9ACTN|nr:ion channel [Streptomyces sp. DSM 42041]MDT0378905.1 ion channel [Streptomyces sp. DSM 42041]